MKQMSHISVLVRTTGCSDFLSTRKNISLAPLALLTFIFLSIYLSLSALLNYLCFLSFKIFTFRHLVTISDLKFLLYCTGNQVSNLRQTFPRSSIAKMTAGSPIEEERALHQIESLVLEKEYRNPFGLQTIHKKISEIVGRVPLVRMGDGTSFANATFIARHDLDMEANNVVYLEYVIMHEISKLMLNERDANRAFREVRHKVLDEYHGGESFGFECICNRVGEEIQMIAKCMGRH